MAEIKDCTTCQLQDAQMFCTFCKTHDGNPLYIKDKRTTEKNTPNAKDFLNLLFKQKESAVKHNFLIPKSASHEEELCCIYHNILVLMHITQQMLEKMPYFNEMSNNNKPKR